MNCVRSRVVLEAAAESAARESSGGGGGGGGEKDRRTEKNHKVDLLMGSKVKIKLHGAGVEHARQMGVIPNGHSRSLMTPHSRSLVSSYSQHKGRELIEQKVHPIGND